MPVLHVEYPEYRKEMEVLKNKPFYHYVQTNNVFKKIPNKIIYTTYDGLDINEYMISSFKILQSADKIEGAIRILLCIFLLYTF